MRERIIVLALGFSLGALAQSKPVTSPSPMDALKIVSVQLVPEEKTAKVVVQNASQKAITGFAISLLWHYANGEERPDGLVTDLAVGIALVGAPGVQGVGPGVTFAPGETQTLRFGNFTARDGSPATAATAHPAMVAFDDRTATGDPKDIQILISERRDQSSDFAELMRRVRAVQSVPDRAQALQSHLDEIARMESEHGRTRDELNTYSFLNGKLAYLKAMLALPELFDKQVVILATQAAFVAEQSSLKY